MDPTERRLSIEHHRQAIRQLEAEGSPDAAASWPPSGFYLLWHLIVGMMVGALGALVSLGANALGAHMVDRHPLDLIRVYLTFPMGANALEVEEGALLFVGSVIYLLTGALFGILFHLVMTIYFAGTSAARRFAVATFLGLALWIINFYFILSWLQPILLGGNWIVRLVPMWVGALTHLTFAWTVAACEIWGRFDAYRGSSPS